MSNLPETEWEHQKNYKMETSWGTLLHAPRGRKECLTPACSHSGIPLQMGNVPGQLLTPACTIIICHVWADGPSGSEISTRLNTISAQSDSADNALPRGSAQEPMTPAAAKTEVSHDFFPLQML